ncbi:MAG: SET domain-containing protein-lysine N-methyltransferase [Vicinamibacteria bacterium]
MLLESATLHDVIPRPSTETRPWWAGGTLRSGPDGLEIAGFSVSAFAEEHGTPVYLYDGARITDRLAQLRSVLGQFERHQILYAMKANRFRPVLEVLRADGQVGIDACSPREVTAAFESGFSASEVSVTASSLSVADLEFLSRSGVHVNFDQVNALTRYAERARPGARVGLRLDPGVSAGYGVNPLTNYGGGKLGLAPEDLPAALDAARASGLVVDTLHLHLGWGLRESDEPAFRHALEVLRAAAGQIETLDAVNVGGGLGGSLREGDRPLSPERWAAAIRDVFGSSGPRIVCEPGTFLTASAGILVSRIAAAWTKRGQRWLGLDCGQATNVYAAHYGLELEIVPVHGPATPPTQRYDVAGNVNESGDVFARDRALPDLGEGDLVALLPAGAYGSSMASDHCLRGAFAEELVWSIGAGAPAPIDRRAPRKSLAPWPSRVQLLADQSRGVFSSADLAVGTLVGRFEGPVVPWREVPEREVRYVIQVKDDGWLIPMSSARFINHSCAPKCAVDAAFNLITVSSVSAGEQLTFSYDALAQAEWQRAPELYFWDERWSFDCGCGATECVGRVDRYRIRP